jgi:hypothetical protein
MSDNEGNFKLLAATYFHPTQIFNATARDQPQCKK